MEEEKKGRGIGRIPKEEEHLRTPKGDASGQREAVLRWFCSEDDRLEVVPDEESEQGGHSVWKPPLTRSCVHRTALTRRCISPARTSPPLPRTDSYRFPPPPLSSSPSLGLDFLSLFSPFFCRSAHSLTWSSHSQGHFLHHSHRLSLPSSRQELPPVQPAEEPHSSTLLTNGSRHLSCYLHHSQLHRDASSSLYRQARERSLSRVRSPFLCPSLPPLADSSSDSLMCDGWPHIPRTHRSSVHAV